VDRSGIEALYLEGLGAASIEETSRKPALRRCVSSAGYQNALLRDEHGYDQITEHVGA
jgi:hypothetical protein